MNQTLQLQTEGEKGILISGNLNAMEIKELKTALNGNGSSKLQMKKVRGNRTLVIVPKQTDLLSVINGGEVSDELRGKIIMPVVVPRNR